LHPRPAEISETRPLAIWLDRNFLNAEVSPGLACCASVATRRPTDEQELSELELIRQQRVEIREYLRQQTAMKV
jgi:hypothetical protein